MIKGKLLISQTISNNVIVDLGSTYFVGYIDELKGTPPRLRGTCNVTSYCVSSTSTTPITSMDSSIAKSMWNKIPAFGRYITVSYTSSCRCYFPMTVYEGLITENLNVEFQHVDPITFNVSGKVKDQYSIEMVGQMVAVNVYSGTTLYWSGGPISDINGNISLDISAGSWAMGDYVLTVTSDSLSESFDLHVDDQHRITWLFGECTIPSVSLVVQ